MTGRFVFWFEAEDALLVFSFDVFELGACGTGHPPIDVSVSATMAADINLNCMCIPFILGRTFELGSP